MIVTQESFDSCSWRDAPKPAFEVRPSSATFSLDQRIGFDPGGRFSATNAPVFWLITSAYGEFQPPVRIAGHRALLTQSEHYDITAKATIRRRDARRHGGVPGDSGLLRTFWKSVRPEGASRDSADAHLQSVLAHKTSRSVRR